MLEQTLILFVIQEVDATGLPVLRVVTLYSLLSGGGCEAALACEQFHEIAERS